MDKNGLTGGEYAEPYAGGSGVAISLLLDGYAGKIHINDVNRAVYAFWRSAFFASEELCDLIRTTPVSMRTWRRQKQILESPKGCSQLELGFAAFFLNRTNRSGILQGGVIGGKKQKGRWKIDARYNKDSLCLKIETLATYNDQVCIYNLDAEALLRKLSKSLPKKSLIYLDPPYFVKSQRLYENLYNPADHARIARAVQDLRRPWLISYDDVQEIRALYRGYRRRSYALSYSAADKYTGTEALFFSDILILPYKTSETLRSLGAAA